MITPTEFQLDALKEIVNTGVGKAASSLNAMLESHIELEVPSISWFNLQELAEGPDKIGNAPISCVQLSFQGTLSGTAALVFPPQSAVKLVAALTGVDPVTSDLDAVMAGTLNEVGNIVINGVVGTIGNILAKPFEYSLPIYLEGKLADVLRPNDPALNVTILLVRTHFQVQDRQVEGNIFLIFELGSFEALLSIINSLCAGKRAP